MACERKARFRHNTIAFWLSDEEKKEVEAKIILSGLPKGEYYRKSILGQKIRVTGNRYWSVKLAARLEIMYQDAKSNPRSDDSALVQVLEELVKHWKDQESDAGEA